MKVYCHHLVRSVWILFSSDWLLFAVNGTDCAEEIDTIQPYNSVAAMEIKAPPNGRILTSGNRRVQQRWHVNLSAVSILKNSPMTNRLSRWKHCTKIAPKSNSCCGIWMHSCTWYIAENITNKSFIGRKIKKLCSYHKRVRRLCYTNHNKTWKIGLLNTVAVFSPLEPEISISVKDEIVVFVCFCITFMVSIENALPGPHVVFLTEL